MKHLVKSGRYYVLPIEGDIIRSVSASLSVFDFRDNKDGKLILDSNFKIWFQDEEYVRFGLAEDMVDFLETQIIDKKISYARSDNRGNLTLKINDIEVFVEDGPYESWHYIDYPGRLQVHGGCGRVV